MGINTSGSVPSSNAILDLNTGNAGNRGVLIPNVTLGASLSTFTPPMANAPNAGDKGMIVYNSVATNQPVGYYYWNGAAWVEVGSGSLINVLYITAPTAGAIHFDQGTSSILYKVLGAGGAGGGVQWTSCNYVDNAGSGGGAGAYIEGYLNGLSSISTYSVVLGPGGVGVAACSGQAQNGSNTVLTIVNPVVILTAHGGNGGMAIGSNTTASALGGAGGVGVASAGSPLIITGASGGRAVISTNGVNNDLAGAGGSTLFGSGGMSLDNKDPVQYPGQSATVYGAGGGGAIMSAANATHNSNQPGGNGGPGIVIIYEYR